MITSIFLNLSNHLIFELIFFGILERIGAENERRVQGSRCGIHLPSTLNLGFLGKLCQKIPEYRDPLFFCIFNKLMLVLWWRFVRSIITKIGGFPRPLLDLSPLNFAKLFDAAVGFKLIPPFDPYLDTTNYLLASYVIPYVGLVGYVGTIPNLVNQTSLSVRTSIILLNYYAQRVCWVAWQTNVLGSGWP